MSLPVDQEVAFSRIVALRPSKSIVPISRSHVPSSKRYHSWNSRNSQSDKSVRRTHQRVEHIYLHSSKDDTEQAVKKWYSQELADLSAANIRLSTALVEQEEDVHHDATQSEAQVWKFANASSVTVYDEKMNSISGTLDSALDPFIGLVADVTPRQQCLLQFFIRDVSPTMFGTSETALYSPAQAVGLPAFTHSKVGMQWICILADEIVHAMSGQKRSIELSHQRSKGYTDLKMALRRRQDHFEEAILGIVIAGLVEYSFGTPHSQSLHTIAADMLIHSRGGLENTLRATPNLEPFYIHAQYAFGRCRIPLLTDLEQITAELLAELQSILECDRSLLRKCLNTPQTHITCQCMMLEGMAIQRVMKSLAVHDPSPFAVGMQLTLLIEVASALLEFTHRCGLAIKYFRRVDFICRHSMIDRGDSTKACELQAGSLASICSRARRDTIEQDDSRVLMQSDVRTVRRHIIALKPFGYLTSQGQKTVLNHLTLWLQRDGKGYISDYDLDQLNYLKSEASQTWYQHYGVRK